MSLALERLRQIRAARREGASSRALSQPDAVSPMQAPAGPYVETRQGYLAPEDLPEPWWEWYEERAAIREYEGGQAREHAEAEALTETLLAMRQAGENADGAS